ncbi:MAG: hypothetical protein JW938_02645 [Candidatus Omnitrophica bacterium]|nr:hypothetical protein [Candidatus Omnitrophota bacterium]
MKRIKNIVALSLAAFVIIFMMIGILFYGYAQVKQALAQQQLVIDSVVQAIAQQFVVFSAKETEGQGRSVTDELREWLAGLNDASGKLKHQMAVLGSLQSNSVWQDNIEKRVVSADWLKTVERSVDELSKHLAAGKVYQNGAFLDRMTEAARVRVMSAAQDPAAQLTYPILRQMEVLQDMSFYIIKQDGSFVVPRESLSERRNAIWQNYHAQMVNEMRLDKEGWLYFPPKASWQLDQDQFVIRYVTINDGETIVAVESFLPSELRLFSEVFTAKLVGSLLLAGLIAFALMQIVAYVLLRRLDGMFLEYTGKSYLAGKKQETARALKDNSAQKPFKKIVERPKKDVAQEIEAAAVLQQKLVSLKKAVYEKAESNATSDYTITTRPAPEKAETSKKQNETFTTSRLLRPQNAPRAQKAEPAAGNVFHDEAVIDVNNIRSSALKKVISEFREEKTHKQT